MNTKEVIMTCQKEREEKQLAWERRPEKEKQKYKQIKNQIAVQVMSLILYY